MLISTKGNLIDLAEQGHFDVIVHGCNCQNTMGSGIAKEIRSRYPKVYEADTIHANYMAMTSTPYNSLGTYSSQVVFNQPYKPFVVVNAYTQYHYLPRGEDHFEYLAFDLILKKISARWSDRRIGLPFIGMGLAGGNRERILTSIRQFANQMTKQGGSVTLVEYDNAN